MAYLSKFAHKLVKNGYIARFNSLKNIPVFYSEDLDEKVERHLASDLENECDDSIKHIIELLQKNKVIVPNSEYDDIVLRAIRSEIKKPYPHILYLILTEKCNFACDYCFIERHMDQNKTNIMTREVAQTAIDFFVKQISNDSSLFEEEKNILFYGGEPLTNFDVLEYATRLINDYKKIGKLPKKTNLGMVTNGTLITDEVAKKLNSLGVSFSISLDGATNCANSCRKYHDGRAGYEDIVRGLEVAKKHNCDVGLSVTLSQEALKESDKIFDLIDKYKINGLGFNILLTDDTYSVPEEYFVEVSNFIVRAFKTFREKGIYEDRVMRKVNAFIEHRVYFFDCGAEGGNQLVIAPNGDVGICHGYLATRESFVTSVFDKSFAIEKNATFLEWNKRTPLYMPQCFDCMALGTCGGGCAMNAKANGTSIWDLDKRFCIHAKTTLEFLIWELLEKAQKSK